MDARGAYRTVLRMALDSRRLFPFLAWRHRVDAASAKDDAMAGLTGALIVLPQAVAFATIAGLPPEYGLYAAMAPAIVAALFGSSWHLVSGPTTAISIAVYASVSPYATPGSPEFVGFVLTLALLTGIFQLALGLARMGVLVNFVSHTVVIGFTAGAALLIAGSQISNFFGIAIQRGTPFFEVLLQLVLRIGEADPYVVAVSATTLATGIAARRYLPKVPFMIAGLVAGSVLGASISYFAGDAASGIRTVGALPARLPPLSIPDLSVASLSQMLFPAIVITVLGLTEAVSIARAIAARSGQRIDGNQEFIGQGLSNIVGAFLSAYPSSGSFNRSGVNYVAGAKTPLAAVFASFVLVILLLVVGPLVAYLPTAAMAGILFLVAWGLIDFHHIRQLYRISRSESVVLWATLLGTLFDLEKGIVVGVALSLALYLYRTSRPVIEAVVPDPDPSSYHFVSATGQKECPQIRMVRLNGSIYFGAIAHLERQLDEVEQARPGARHLVVMASGINFVDVAGAEFLAQLARRYREAGGSVVFYRLKDAVAATLRSGDFMADIGEENLVPAGMRPTERLAPKLDEATCAKCPLQLFRHCHATAGA